ncbi:CoA transferase [bacterium]|nr:MAG: CoA transferase [bacterium]MCL4230033.1 CoA transferase [Dehalococcoidia bacterium]
MTRSTPLANVRVLETASWNGAYAGRLLADGGADVVRVVPPSGDPLDSEPPFFGSSGKSVQATWYNAGKRLLPLDVAVEGGIERFHELVRNADILLDDGDGPLDSSRLRLVNPSLARVSISPAGEGGPWANLQVNDLVANALCGSASVTGNLETPPLNGYGNQTVHTVGLYAAICALAAHRAAKATGQFQHVDLSAHEALISCTEQVLMQWFFPDAGAWTSPVAARLGSLHWSGGYEVYQGQTGGGIMVTAALNFAQVLLPWLVEEGAAQDLADPAKYPDIIAMIRDLPYVMKVLREWVAANDAEQLFFEAQRRHQPFGLVRSIRQALEIPQVEARGYLQEQAVPGFGQVQFPGRLFRTSADGPHPAPPRATDWESIRWSGVRPPAPRTKPPADPSRPLTGIRVMDFTHVLAGPFGTRVLGDLGADIIKVGTASRIAGANSLDHPYFVCWNRNKRNILLNLAHPQGRAVAHRLAGQCDIITENFSAGVLARMGLDRPSLASTHPGVTVISMGGMGQSGPWKDFVTYAPTIHALCGLTHMTNPPGRYDLGYGFSLTDHLSGLACAVAALEGLEHRDRTGEGLAIDLAQFELGLGIMAPSLLDHLANGIDPEPAGNRHPFGAWAPHGIYRCAGDDRWVAIAVRGDGQWRALCEVMARMELAGDPRFATHTARLANEDALDAVVEDWTRPRDRYEVMAACQAAGIAAGAVQDAEDLATRDPQLRARDYFGAVESERWGTTGIDRFPARFNGVRPGLYQGVHEFGADTFEVLEEVLGLSPDEIAGLVAAGALE